MPISGLRIVRPEHQAFYRRVFLHEPIAEPRLFPGLIKPVGIDGGRLSGLCGKRSCQRFPIMRSSAFERRMLFQRAGERHATPHDVVDLARARLDRSERPERPAAAIRPPDRSAATGSTAFRPDPNQRRKR